MSFQNDAKQWFKTALKPSQAQFWAVFGWLRWKDEDIDIADVNGLDAALVLKGDKVVVDALVAAIQPEIKIYNVDSNYIIPIAFVLEKMVVIPTNDIDLTIGITPGGNEIISAMTMHGNTEEVVEVNIPAIRAAKTIYITGITSQTKFYMYKR